MAAIERIDGIESFMRERIEIEKRSYEDISKELQEALPTARGLSARSVRRFCAEYGIHKTSRLPDHVLDRVVASSVAKVGATYGRRMMSGLLSSQGVQCADKRIGASLKRVDPGNHTRRQTGTERMINPRPYRSDYFGEKLHIDQNEKLVMFGLTHVCAIDGFSGKIVGFAIMPRKNNITIYEHLYMDIVCKFGIWDQIRVDYGREWYLMLYVNQMVASMRNDTQRPPHMQTSSKQNHTIERIWVEVNSRVNYPIKAVLVEMADNGEISLDDPTTQFCTSCFSIKVASAGVTLFLTSWNQHPISGKGTPDVRMGRDNRAQRIDINYLPSPHQAACMYADAGGTLTDPSPFGSDPIADCPEKIGIRDRSFANRYPSASDLFHEVVNGTSHNFKQALLFYIDITRRLSLS